MTYLFAPIISFYLTVVIIPPLCRLATQISLVDVPDQRKIHETNIPRIGGLGIIAGILFTVFLWIWFVHLPITRQFIAYLSGLTILMITGIIDDFYNLNYKKKLLGQCIAVGVTLLIGKTFITNLGVWTTTGEIILSDCIAIPLTFIFIVGVTNAVNLLDGLDGLAGGISIFIFSLLAIISFLDGRTDLLIYCLAIVGALFAFLKYNSHPAIVFMGDTGSLFLGFTAAIISIALTQYHETAIARTLPLLILGLPITDTIFVFTARIIKGGSPFYPDRKHFHYQLLTMGFTHGYAVLWIYFLQSILFFLSVKLRYYPEPWIILVYASIFFYVLLFLYIAHHSKRRFTGGQKMLIAFSQRINKPSIMVLKIISENYIKVVLSLGILWLSISSPIVNTTLIHVIFLFTIATLITFFLKSYLLKYFFYLTIYLLIAVLLFSSQRVTIFPIPFSQQTFHHFFWGSIAISVIVFHLITKFETLRDTTLDYIVLLMVLSLPFFPSAMFGRLHLGTIAGGMLAFIWSSELLIRNQKKRVNFFTTSCIASIIILFLRSINSI